MTAKTDSDKPGKPVPRSIVLAECDEYTNIGEPKVKEFGNSDKNIDDLKTKNSPAVVDFI